MNLRPMEARDNPAVKRSSFEIQPEEFGLTNQELSTLTSIQDHLTDYYQQERSALLCSEDEGQLVGCRGCASVR